MDDLSNIETSNRPSRIFHKKAVDDWELVHMPIETPQQQLEEDNMLADRVEQQRRDRSLHCPPICPAPLPLAAFMAPLYAGAPKYTIPNHNKSPHAPRYKKLRGEGASLALLEGAEKAMLTEISLEDDDEYSEWLEFLGVVSCIVGTFVVAGVVGLLGLGFWFWSM